MTAQTRPLLWLLLVLCAACPGASFAENTGNFVYKDGTESYSYTVKQTGENYTYEFSGNPGVERKKLKAALHVLQSVYGDSSINPNYSETFMKESALCFVFDGRFYAYRVCFLPNDYSPGNRERFWGFTSRLPNALWLITRNLLPALLAVGLLFLYPKLKRTGGA